MTDEKNDLVSVTILVDRKRGLGLDHICARCGVEAKSTPACFESIDRSTGTVHPDGVFQVRSASPPKGWEHMRITYANGDGTKHIEVCHECIRAFFRSIGAEPAIEEPEPWADKEDEWTEGIQAAFPTRSGSHEQYATAMEMIGNRHSKDQLVALVNWLLLRNAEVLEDLKSHRVHLAFAARENLFGVKPDGTPSEASLYITKLRVLLDRVLKDARISGADQVSDETKKAIREALAPR